MNPSVQKDDIRPSPKTGAGTPLVAAVFATMNRREIALSCLRALAAQTRTPDLVIVADNVSTDGTADALENQLDLPFPLVVHRMSENLGSAGGVYEAMETAFARQMDAVWILDDDSWPRPEALEELLLPPVSDEEVRHSIQIDPKSCDLTWPMQVHQSNRGWHTVFSLHEISGMDSVVTRNNWTGSLVPRRVRDLIGPVMGDLIIRGEDEEYPWRFQEAGIPQKAMMRSILDHPGPTRLRHSSFLGKSIYFEQGLADWKLYYKIRNMIWLQRRKRGIAAAFLLWLAYSWIVIRYDGVARLPLVIEATSDGFSGRLGRWKHHPL